MIAHRGASAARPENTMAAFIHAIELGADGVEFDVQQTAEGDLVVIHDLTLDRTTDRRGLVFETPTHSVRDADTGGWFDSRFVGERVPFLAEVLRLRDIRFELELKGFTRDFAQSVIDEVLAADVLTRVEFTSSHPLLLEYVRRVVPGARIGCFAPPRPDWMPLAAHRLWSRATAEMIEADVLHFHAGLISEDLLAEVHSWGFAIHAADVADDDLARVLALDVDQLSTARPELVRQ
ncbi:MAG: glycerophosphodiester phosphodiesterase [Mycobacteriales bacterium]